MLTVGRGLVIVRPISIRYDVITEADARSQLGLENIDLVQEEHNAGICE